MISWRTLTPHRAKAVSLSNGDTCMKPYYYLMYSYGYCIPISEAMVMCVELHPMIYFMETTVFIWKN